MGFFQRLFGICQTNPPADPSCWNVTGSTLTVDLQKSPELAASGGAIRIDGRGIDKRVLVFKGDDDQYHALINRCGHGGRRLDPMLGEGTVQCCSIGKSTYDYCGKRLSGSSRKDIRALELKHEGSTLTIDL
ncbi:MAG: Rieske 2Fe-2S domain-containing protein [Deltaproteobacteria bacterium]|nr:Rieske 2Fe-2S domain-containing protein [Deltaproteobacteria bacterium]